MANKKYTSRPKHIKPSSTAKRRKPTPRRSSMPVGTVCYLLSSFDITCLTLHYPNQVFRE